TCLFRRRTFVSGGAGVVPFPGVAFPEVAAIADTVAPAGLVAPAGFTVLVGTGARTGVRVRLPRDVGGRGGGDSGNPELQRTRLGDHLLDAGDQQRFPLADHLVAARRRGRGHRAGDGEGGTAETARPLHGVARAA